MGSQSGLDFLQFSRLRSLQTNIMKVLLVLAIAASASAAPVTYISGAETIPFKGTTTFKDLGANQLLATNVQQPIVYSSPITYSGISSPITYSALSSPIVSGISSPVISGYSGISGISGISGYFPTAYTGISGIQTNAIVPKTVAATAGSSHVVY